MLTPIVATAIASSQALNLPKSPMLTMSETAPMVQKFVLLTTTPRMTDITNVDHKKNERLSVNDSKIILLPLSDNVNRKFE